MRNWILLIILVTSANVKAQIPNGDFENWQIYDLFEVPGQYGSTAGLSFLYSFNSNISKTDGEDGFAVKLQTNFTFNGTVPGVITLSDLAFNLSGAYPYSDTPDSMYLTLRYDIMPEDSGFVYFAYRANNQVIAADQWYITGTADSFYQAEIALPMPPVTPDSLIFVVSSSNFSDPHIGSFIEIDQVELVGNNAAQFPNNGFEDWIFLQDPEPDNWTTDNLVSLLFKQKAGITATNDSYTGDLAIKLEARELPADVNTVGNSSGILFSGADPDAGDDGFALDFIPDALRGYYKYEAIGFDNAIAFVSFSKYDSVEGRIVLFQNSILLQPAATYTPFEIPVTLDEIPDTAVIAFSASNISLPNPYYGSVLYLDDLSFGVLADIQEPEFSVLDIWPNPAKESISVSGFEGSDVSFRIIRSDGALFRVGDVALNAGKWSVDVSNLAAGFYVLQVVNKEQTFSGTFVINR